MRLTEQDVKMFADIKDTAIGKWMADYCTRLQTFMCDCRYWDEKTDRGAMVNAAEKIEQHIVGNLRNSNPKVKLPDFK